MTDFSGAFSRNRQAVDRRYMLKQRRILDDIAKASEVLSRYRHAGAQAAENAATGIQTALLEYELALAETNRHTFGDLRRSRARKPLFPQPEARLLKGPDCADYAREFLRAVFSRMDQAVANLMLRTNPAMPQDLKGTDAADKRFHDALLPVVQRLRADLSLIGW
ncbi:MAG: hypothetical protein DCC64_15420 [Planctomycetota bacterium]|nr:MAG: hypothetical protein DCC64_15420 [Planctomycetota bacterium]